ncbi:MAG: hypothetical protein FJ138_18805 [Deltaproteobacteria bacterium]|nr:hypothetical protein [Deltaproteobacteria bacterium]
MRDQLPLGLSSPLRSPLRSSLRGAVLALSALGASCAPPQPTAVEVVEEKPSQIYKVDLPKRVDLEALIPPLQHPDGTFRVDGLLMRFDEHMGDTLEVTGYVVEKSPTCAAPRKDKPVDCPIAHFWLADANGQTSDRLRVVELDRKLLAKIKENQKYRVKGTFQETSKDGFVSSMGLLIYQGAELIKE